MNKRERLAAALENRETDRPPVGFWYHFPDGADVVESQLRFYRESGMDFCKIMCDGYFSYPNPGLKEVHRAKDLDQLKPMDPGHPYFREQVERAARIVRELKEECFVFYSIFCPMSYLRFGTSEEQVMAFYREDPEAFAYGLSVVAEDASRLARLLITEAGCDGVYYSVQNAELSRFSFEEYRKYVTPSDKAVLLEAEKYSPYNILHCCGWAGDKNRVEVWQDYPGAAVNWAIYVEGLPLPKGKEFFGGRCVLGGFQNTKDGVLYRGSKEEVSEFTAGLIQEVGGRGFILGADCTVPGDISMERLRWVAEAAEKHKERTVGKC